MRSKIENKGYGLGCLILLIPFLLITNVISVLMIKNDVEILKSDFQKGVMHLDSIECNSISGSDGDNEICHGYGTVNNISTKVKLGNENKIDLTIKKYSVFYRSDGKFTLLSKSNVLDKKKYLRKTIFIAIFLILINTITGVMFFKLRKNKNEKKS